MPNEDSRLLVSCQWMRGAQRDALRSNTKFDCEAAMMAEREVDRILRQVGEGWGRWLPRLVQVARRCRDGQRRRNRMRSSEALEQVLAFEADLDRVMAEIAAEMRSASADEAQKTQEAHG